MLRACPTVTPTTRHPETLRTMSKLIEVYNQQGILEGKKQSQLVTQACTLSSEAWAERQWRAGLRVMGSRVSDGNCGACQEAPDL